MVDAEGGKEAIASDMFNRYFGLALIRAHKQYSLAPTCLFLLIVVSQTDAVNGIFTPTVLRPIIFADEVNRGQDISTHPPRARVVVHFSGQRALLGSQRLTDVPEGSSISFVDGELVNIAAQGQTADNRTRLMVVEQAGGWIDPSSPTRKGADFYYYGVEGTEPPPPSTTAPGGDNRTGGRDR